MIENPLDYVADFKKAGADIITFHVESSSPTEETVDKIRQKHGSASILQGSVMSSDIGIFKVGYDGTAEKDN